MRLRTNRRTVLRGGLMLGGATALGALGVPAGATLVRAGRPRLTHGIQSGDATAHGAMVWARADRPARMLVEVSRSPERFVPSGNIFEGPALTPNSDLTGKVRLDGLPPGQDVGYRITLADLGDPSLTSAPEFGIVRTAPRGHQDIRFVWSGDLAGQGWGINPDFGGFRIFNAMAELAPHFFLCSGDIIYADGPIAPTQPLPDGSLWHNVTTQAKSKVAETLDEFRGNYQYNLLDENLRRFNARVPQINQWDDHETVNNWYPGEILDDPRYTEKRVDVLAARANRAFFEYLPIGAPTHDGAGRIYRVVHYGPLLDVFVLDMKAHRDPNGPNHYTEPGGGILGAEQLAWLKRELAASRATWKIIAADQPIGLIVPDGSAAFEAVAQGDPGTPLGRELQLADLLSFVHRRGITGLVWLTADVHYTAAHYYDPERAAFSEFTPFWEFVTGPLNAGGFGPNTLDATFGPQVRFQQAPPAPNAAPVSGYQFFGEVSIDGSSQAMTVRLRDLDGQPLHTVTLDPA